MLLSNLFKNDAKMIISHRNCGLGDNLLATAAAWYYASITGRTLVICWAPSRYLPNIEDNAFNYFFEVPQEIHGVRVISEKSIDAISIFRICQNNDFSSFSGRGLDDEQDIINNLVAVKDKVFIANGCYSPYEKFTPFFDALKPSPKFKNQADDFAEKYF